MKSYNNFIVDARALKTNIANIKSNLNKNVKLCACVKADAYGVGFKTVCNTLKDVDFFAVACLKEALEIRKFNSKTPILVLGIIPPYHINLCAQKNICISVGSLKCLKKYIKYATKKIKIHLQVNTGMNRFGFNNKDSFQKAIKLINSGKNLILDGVYSHFACAESNQKFTLKQFNIFKSFKNLVENKNVIFHICNSYATIKNKEMQMDMVRCGFFMYSKNYLIKNLPVVSITSRIVHVFNVKKGETVGYDRIFRAKKDMKIGVVPIGYADGLDRTLSNGFSLIVNGKKCRIVGLICMDACMIDISNSGSKILSIVTLLGRQKNEQITIDDYASALNTSPYEILLKFNHKRMNYIVKN